MKIVHPVTQLLIQFFSLLRQPIVTNVKYFAKEFVFLKVLEIDRLWTLFKVILKNLFCLGFLCTNFYR